MSLITSRGSESAESIKREKLSVKDEYIVLTTDEAIQLRILGKEEYVGYMSHGSFTHSIFTQPCPDPDARDCEYCKASNAGHEEFHDLKLRQRFTFAFVDLGEKRIKLLDVSKNQAKKLLSSIEEYEDILGEMPFTLRRIGKGTDTAYSLSPIIKAKAPVMDAFKEFDGEEVPLSFFSDRLEAKVSTGNFKIKLLSEAGFPRKSLDRLFGEEVVESALTVTDTADKVEKLSENELDDIV